MKLALKPPMPGMRPSTLATSAERTMWIHDLAASRRPSPT